MPVALILGALLCVVAFTMGRRAESFTRRRRYGKRQLRGAARYLEDDVKYGFWLFLIIAAVVGGLYVMGHR